jgi:3-hydroxyisobutyrate dehydrogenase
MVTAVSFIGTGIMGSSMAGHLLAAGHPLHVHSRTRSKAERIGRPMALSEVSRPSAAAEQLASATLSRHVADSPAS